MEALNRTKKLSYQARTVVSLPMIGPDFDRLAYSTECKEVSLFDPEIFRLNPMFVMQNHLESKYGKRARKKYQSNREYHKKLFKNVHVSIKQFLKPIQETDLKDELDEDYNNLTQLKYEKYSSCLCVQTRRAVLINSMQCKKVGYSKVKLVSLAALFK